MRNLRLTKDINSVLYTVIGAFFLALIIGLVVKNPFGTVLMRAFLSALLFGALVYAGVWMLKRYIPEWETSDRGGKKIDGGVGEKEKSVPVTEHEENYTEHGLQEQENEEDKYPEAGDTDGGLDAGTYAVMTQEAGEANAAREDDSLPSLDELFVDEEKVPSDYQTEPKPTSSRKKGEKIELGDFRIPYEPETLAKAIKKVMSQDERR